MESVHRGARQLVAVGQQCCGATWQVWDRADPTFLAFSLILRGRHYLSIDGWMDTVLRRLRMLDKTRKWVKMADFVVKIATSPLNGSGKCTAWRQKTVCSGATVLRRHLAGLGPWWPRFLRVFASFEEALPTPLSLTLAD